MPPRLPNPALDAVAGHSRAAGFGDDGRHASGVAGKPTPVELEMGAAFRAARGTDRLEIGPAPENARPGKAAITPRCGGRSGAPHLWAEDGGVRAPDGVRGRPVPLWFSCGPGSRTGGGGYAWRDCKWVSWTILDKRKKMPEVGSGVNACPPKPPKNGGSHPPCWRHAGPPAAGSLHGVLFSRRPGFWRARSSFGPAPNLRGAPSGW